MEGIPEASLDLGKELSWRTIVRPKEILITEGRTKKAAETLQFSGSG